MSDPHARGAYLDAAGAGNPPRRERVEKLLPASPRADQFLADNPLELDEATRLSTATVPVSEGPGTVLAFVQARCQLSQNRNELRLGFGRHGPHESGHVRVSLRKPSRPGARILFGDLLAPALMEQRHGNPDIILAGDVEHGIDVLEAVLVRREWAGTGPGFLAIDIGLRAVAHT